MVDESPQDNNSMIYLSENTLEKLGLFRSDSVLLKGKKRRETIAVVLASPECDDNKIKMNKGKLQIRYFIIYNCFLAKFFLLDFLSSYYIISIFITS